MFDITNKMPIFVHNINQNAVKEAHIITYSQTDNEGLRREY
jgi:hypothetical protein